MGVSLTSSQGISLSVQQYVALLKAAPGINATLRDLGHVIDSDEDMDDAPVPPKSKTKKEKPKPSKSNIEATSDEEEED